MIPEGLTFATLSLPYLETRSLHMWLKAKHFEMQSQDSPETQLIVYTCITYIRWNSLEELAHFIMETRKSQGRMSVSWESSGADSMVQNQALLLLESKDVGLHQENDICLEVQKPMSLRFRCGRAREGQHSCTKRQRNNWPFFHLSVLLRSLATFPACFPHWVHRTKCFLNQKLPQISITGRFF